MDFPFIEKRISSNKFLREFKETTDSKELIWHLDKEKRIVHVLESNGWKLQYDNKLPVLLEKGKTYVIEAFVYHRVLKGKGDLKVIVEKL